MSVQVVYPKNNYDASVLLICQNCNNPCCCNITCAKIGDVEQVRATKGSILAIKDTKIIGFWPEHPKPLVAEHVPESVERALLQAESNYWIRGNEDAAAIMYRRAMEAAFKYAFPEISGSLYKSIEALATRGDLPQSLKEWAHEVRIVGNDGAHDEDGSSREDIDAARAFTDTLMRYLFTLPEQVRQRRAARAPVDAPT